MPTQTVTADCYTSANEHTHRTGPLSCAFWSIFNGIPQKICPVVLFEEFQFVKFSLANYPSASLSHVLVLLVCHLALMGQNIGLCSAASPLLCLYDTFELSHKS